MQSTRYEDDPPLPKVPAGLGLRIATVVELAEGAPGPAEQAPESGLDGPVLVAEALRKAAAEDEKPAGGDKHLGHVFTQLQLRDLRVPAVKACVADGRPKAEEFCNEAFESVFAEDLAGLALGSGTLACACMSIVSYWPKGSFLGPDEHLCIPLQGYALPPGGGQDPILYLPTVQDDLFLIVLCGGLFSAEKVAEMLAAGEMLETQFTSAKIPLVALRGLSPAAGTTLGNRAVASATHAFAIDVAEGAKTPGALAAALPSDDALVLVAAPFTLAVYHQDLGDAEVPLVVAHVA